MNQNPHWTERLAHTERRTEIEKAASELHAKIEDMGAHPLLTDAGQLVHDALCTLRKWHDDGEPGRNDLSHKV